MRRRPHAPVSTPLAWSEVTASLRAEDFTLGNYAARLKKRDPWAGFFGRRQALEPRVLKIGRIVAGMEDMLRHALGEPIDIETIVAGGEGTSDRPVGPGHEDLADPAVGLDGDAGNRRR